MGLPFTQDQFFGLFAEYNRAFWVVAAALWLTSAGILVVGRRSPVVYGRLLTYFLSALWGWNAVAYHLYLFTRINPAAWVFGTMFAFQAVLFARNASSPLAFFSSGGVRLLLGTGLIAYSLVYPALSIIAHPYPAAPSFGVPCPTAILTIGLLLTVGGSMPWRLAIIPLLWAFIGGSAALLLDVPTDYVLLAAGVVLTVVLAAQRGRCGLDRDSVQS